MYLSGLSGGASAGLHALSFSTSRTATQTASQAVQSNSAAAAAQSSGAVQTGPVSGLSSASSDQTWINGVPMSVMNALVYYTSPLDEAWSTLGQDMKSGNYSGALAALNSYTALLPESNLSMSAWTAPSESFQNLLSSLGTAIKQIYTDTLAGLQSLDEAYGQTVQQDIQSAQSLYAKADSNRPDTADEALSSLMGQAGTDGFSFVYALKYKQGSLVSVAGLTADITQIDAVLREKNADIDDALVALGYSKTQASQYAGQITGIQNGSAEDNAAVDQQRAQQWIQGLTALGNAAYDSRPDVDGRLQTSVSDLLSEVLFNRIDGWNQLKKLVDATTQATSSGTASGGLSNSDASGQIVRLLA